MVTGRLFRFPEISRMDPFVQLDRMSREMDIGRYYRRFTLSEAIDQEKIKAQAANGTLRLILPKVEKAKPRRIAIKAE